MIHPWLPNLKSKDRILSEMGINEEKLFSDIPHEIRLKGELNLPKVMSELEIKRKLNMLKEKNVKLKYPPFIGGGVCPHYVHEAVKFLISRSEFYTAYTPYQPEISQGILQALYEYQSIMAELLEMDVVNSSMYDWGSSLAEAVLMGFRINGRKKVIIPELINPNHEKVLRTWVEPRGINLIKVKPSNDGTIDMNDLLNKVGDDISSIYIQQPNFYGIFEKNIEEIVDIAKKKRIVTIMGVNPLALSLIKPPGVYDVDIAVGEGQELGLPLNFGGPYMGIMAVRWDAKLVRQMPGRIVGKTLDDKKRPGYTLILQTREQFARREKATSNITTNEALMAIANAVYLSLLGKNGFKELGEEIYRRSHYAAERFIELGASKKFEGDFFEEFAVSFQKPYEKIHNKLLEHGIHGGLRLNDMDALFCVTEVHSKEAIDELVSIVGEI
ncbi:aminomethyl-transferring glycine dehydrogenase subunit GcvPA [Sulfuracidifex metallicus]|uniref:aminomethyl-transferring glycine dehydrogenase subunit GcvPA n=1 Tax=Sulfuracidifex metallicus TaxID=47303 RepID=UPI0022756E0F|nr:aminomethyl-transferring glycine dehydrogenase subunit GcvPA [Sulfuracidifex metallicus]MCY0850917.1 aminomethyl-transferring glycine dehydrogenase subunit GcvPA [Sulfuracidifex metallicus]